MYPPTIIYKKLIEKAPLKEDAIKELRRIIKLLEVDDKLFFGSFASHLYPFITNSSSSTHLTLISHLSKFKGNLLNEAYYHATKWKHSRFRSKDDIELEINYYLDAIGRVQTGLRVDKINSSQLAFALILFNLTEVKDPVKNYKLTDAEITRIIRFEYTEGNSFWEDHGVSIIDIINLATALLKNKEEDRTSVSELQNNYQLLIKTSDNYLKVEVLENWEKQLVTEEHNKKVKFIGQLLIPNDSIFIESEIDEFEYLINKRDVKEFELQMFLKKTPKFLNLLGGYDCVERELTLTPQILLSDKDRSELRPDFLLKRIGINYWDILETKLPSEPLVVGLDRHRKFSSKVEKAIAQLKSYKDFFNDKTNLKWFRMKYGYDISFPELYLLIGRDNGFNSEEEKSKFSRSESLRILTYDDLHKIAKHRMVSIK